MVPDCGVATPDNGVWCPERVEVEVDCAKEEIEDFMLVVGLITIT